MRSSPPRRSFLAAAIVGAVAVLLSSCALDANWPTAQCAAELESGTPCVPTDGQRGLELFADVGASDAAASERMAENPLSGVLSATCTSMATVYTVCVTSEGGITVITPIVMPDNGRVSFEGAGLDAIGSIELSEPLGLRRDTGEFTVMVRDSDDKLVGQIPLGFYI